MGFVNSYEDIRRAASYAALEFPGTYYLAFRDLPAIIGKHVSGNAALDFGCGTGRSTRFLCERGFDTIGVDISEQMIAKARELDPAGDYRLITDGGLRDLDKNAYDLVLAAFTFDNIPALERKVALFTDLGMLLNAGGRIVLLASTPEIYTHEWTSFSTRDYPENRAARAGDTVRIIMTDVEDNRPVEDILWPDDAYQETFRQAGLEVIATSKPLASGAEPWEWVNETQIAPWVIYVLARRA